MKSLSYEFPLFERLQSETSTTEVWKPVSEAPGYEVSNLGRFRNENGRFLTGNINWTGYRHIGFTINGKQTFFMAHRIVAEAFNEKQDSDKKLLVNHIDGNRLNNKSENLEWVTNQQNVLHWRRPSHAMN
jgi:hypothetical protein